MSLQHSRDSSPFALLQRLVLTLCLMSCAVYVLNLSAPQSTTATQSSSLEYHPASPTTGFNDSSVPCITYWTLGCPFLKGPFFPQVMDASAPSTPSTMVSSLSSSSSSPPPPPPRLGLLRYITTPLPDYHSADDILINLGNILEYSSSNTQQQQQHWFLYRIANQTFAEQVVQLLHVYQQEITVIPFELTQQQQQQQYANIPFTWHVFDSYKNTHRDVIHNKWYQTGVFHEAKQAAVLTAALRDKILYLWNKADIYNTMLDWAAVEWSTTSGSSGSGSGSETPKIDWWLPMPGDTTLWTPAVHQAVTEALLLLQQQTNDNDNSNNNNNNAAKYIVVPRRQVTSRSTQVQSLVNDKKFHWKSETTLDDNNNNNNSSLSSFDSSLYDQTARLVAQTPRDGYQILFHHTAVGRLHPYLARYATQEFLSRLRVDGYGWWNVTADAAWLPTERKIVQHLAAPDMVDHVGGSSSSSSKSQDTTATIAAGRQNALSDPWRLSLQAPPSDWNAQTGVPMINVTIPLLYTTAAERVKNLDLINATHTTALYEAQSMMQAVQALDYQMAQAQANITTAFSDLLPNQLFFYDRAMLKYERNLYQQAQYQTMDASMPKRVQSLVWMVYKLAESARAAHRSGPWSVTDKPKPGPSGDVHDYYNTAPHYVPEILDDGSLALSLPYVKKGYGPPAQPLFAHPRHHVYDETRFVSMSYNVTILSLATFFTGQDIYAQYAVKLLKHWFWDEESYMTPHLRFASVRWNHNESDWQGEHVTDLKSVYFLLDAVQLLEQGGFLKARQLKLFRNWMADFLTWLETSPQGKHASSRDDYHGLYYDIMCASIAYYLRHEAKALHYIHLASSRMRNHFNERYDLRVELSTKSRCEDAQMQALYAWHVLARMAQHLGVDLWRAKISDLDLDNGDGKLSLLDQVRLPQDPLYDPTILEQDLSVLCAASARAIPFVLDRPPCKGDSGDNRRQSHYRWYPLLDGYRRQCPSWPVENLNGTSWIFPKSAKRPPTGRYHMPFMYPHLDNIAPFWNLGYRITTPKAKE